MHQNFRSNFYWVINNEKAIYACDLYQNYILLSADKQQSQSIVMPSGY